MTALSIVHTVPIIALAASMSVTTVSSGDGPADSSRIEPEIGYLLSNGERGVWTERKRLGPAYVESYTGAADAAPTFNVEYLDVTNGTGVGFDDPVLGATRRDTLQAVFDYLASIITDSGSADIEIRESQTDGNSFLAVAGPFFSTENCVDPAPVIHITTGVDPFAESPDATVRVDFGHNWNSGLGEPKADENDLFSVMLHEVTHAIGMISSLRSSCDPLCCPPVPGVATRFRAYDGALVQGETSAMLVDCETGTYNGGDVEGGLGGVLLDAPALNLAWQNAGQEGSPPVYTPDPFACGSSIGHLDSPDDNPNMPSDVVMQPSILVGTARRSYHELDIALLSTLGYAVVFPVACPEDIDDSGAVDFGDILAILGAWGNPGGPEDLDGSGTVDFGDLLSVLGAWGPCP